MTARRATASSVGLGRHVRRATTGRTIMGDATKGFFEELSSRGHEPLLERVSGTVRVELVNGKRRPESWLVSIDKGELEVSKGGGRADCIIRAPRDLFDEIAAGEANA